MATKKTANIDPYADIAQSSTQTTGDTDPYADIAIGEPSEFAASKKNKEGLYPMHGPSGVLHVPYSKVEDAFKSGLRFDKPETFRRFQKDKAAEGPSAVQRFNESQFGDLKNAVKGIGEFLDPRPTEEEKARGLTKPIDTLLRYGERIVAPHVEQENQTEEAIKAGNYSQAVGHGLATVTPMVGPWAAQVGEKVGQQVGAGNIAGALGTLAANAYLAEAPKIGGKIIGKSAAVLKNTTPVRSTVEAITRTGPRQLKQLAEDTAKENVEAANVAAEKNTVAAETHLNDTLDALQKTKEAEDLYSSTEKARKEKLEAKNEADKKKFNGEELERVKKEGEARLKVLEDNKEKVDNYNAEHKRITEENERNYRMEVKRQNLESDLTKESKNLEKEFDVARSRGKRLYNATWNRWRNYIKGAKADMSNTISTIKAQEATMNPQQVALFRDILRQFGKIDVDELNKNSRQAFGTDYDKLNDNQKAVIDKDIADRGGLSANTPKEALATRLHGWKSMAERAVRSTQDGTVRHAIGQVLDELRKEENNVSVAAGPQAMKQLARARAITGPYFDAFFKTEKSLPKVAEQSLREQVPEYIKERDAQRRLDNIAAYNPNLKVVSNRVANIKNQLSNIPKEMKEPKNLPVEPTLKTVPEVNPAREFTPQSFEAKPQPPRIALPDRPTIEVPEKKVWTREDIKNLREVNVKRSANSLREHGIRRSMNALFYTVPSAVFSAMLGHPGYAVAELLSTPAILYGSHALADMLESKAVVSWIGKVTPKDIEVWEQLPPDQRAVFAQDMKTIADAAEKKKIKVSPLMKEFVKNAAKGAYKTGAGEGAKKNNPKELLQQVNDLQSQFQQQGLSPQ